MKIMRIVEEALEESKLVLDKGKLADYIPELTKANPQHLGISILTKDRKKISAGAVKETFTIQSISKVITLLFCLDFFGDEKVFSLVGREPSGTPFSEFITLSDFTDKPKNPFINSGAIALASLLASKMTFEDYLEKSNELFGQGEFKLNQAVYSSELAHSERNHSLAWELKRMKLLTAGLETSLDFYTKVCAIEASAENLVELAFCLANYGRIGEEQIFKQRDIATTLSLMLTCGLYDGSGDFAAAVGIPAKSGVGGGILAVVPGRAGVVTFGPALDDNGNSIGGIELLRILSDQLDFHLFLPQEII